MRNKVVAGFFIFLMSFCFVNCNSNKANKTPTPSIKFSKEGRFLIKEIYDSTGKIETRQYFNKDTVPDGAMIDYNSKGITTAWLWYQAKYKNPDCGIFYYNDGKFDTFKGRPFLGLENNELNKPLVKMINPPQLTTKLIYKDFYLGKVVNDIMYDPILTDTISWVPLDEYNYKQGHRYEVYFYIVDTIKAKLLYQDSIEIKEH